jgi:hypothetical protein
MIKRIPLLWHRVLRIPRSKGYGVQSPFAYRFVREVLNRRSFFTDNIDKDFLKINHPGYDKEDSELFCRLIHYNNPETLLTLGGSSQYFSSLLCAAIKNDTYGQHDFSLMNDMEPSVSFQMFVSTSRVRLNQILSLDNQHFDFIVLPARLFDSEFLEWLLCHVKFSSLLLLTNIHACEGAWNNWCELLSDDRVVMTFDLYTHGIVFFDTTKSKMNYKVNYK